MSSKDGTPGMIEGSCTTGLRVDTLGRCSYTFRMASTMRPGRLVFIGKINFAGKDRVAR